MSLPLPLSSIPLWLLIDSAQRVRHVSLLVLVLEELTTRAQHALVVTIRNAKLPCPRLASVQSVERAICLWQGTRDLMAGLSALRSPLQPSSQSPQRLMMTNLRSYHRLANTTILSTLISERPSAHLENLSPGLTARTRPARGCQLSLQTTSLQ